MLHRIRQVDPSTVDAGLRQRGIEELSGRPDEWVTEPVLLVSRLLTNQHDVGPPEPSPNTVCQRSGADHLAVWPKRPYSKTTAVEFLSAIPVDNRAASSRYALCETPRTQRNNMRESLDFAAEPTLRASVGGLSFDQRTGGIHESLHP